MMKLTPRHYVVFTSLFPFALVLAAVAACSGSLTTIGSGSSGDVDSGSSTADGAASSSSSSGGSGSSTSSSSSGGVDASVGTDSGVTVNEKPAPACHDLTQHGALVTPVGDPNSPPAQVPITTIAPGMYVLVSATDYGGLDPIDPITSSMTTVVFTATRQYYLSQDDTNFTQALTLEWKIANNRLIRKILCAPQPAQIGDTVDYRIDAAPNGGFIVYVPTNGGGPPRLHAYRYKRLP